MKLKKNFPYFVLATLSFILLVVLTIVTYLRTDFPFFTLSHKLILVLQETSFTGGLILVSIWIGVGVNVLLTRVSDVTRRRRLTIGVTLGSFFLCVLLPISSLFIAGSEFNSGNNESWQPLPEPPEMPKAIAGGVYRTVIIETQSGNYFSCSFEELDQCWQTETKPETLVPERMEVLSTAESDLPEVRPPGKIISIFGMAYYLGSSRYEDYFAVLDNHTVWYLNHPANGGIYAIGLLVVIMIPIATGSLLILLGMFLTSLLRWVAGRIWKDEPIE